MAAHTARQLQSQATEHHKAGRYSEAIQAYRQVLQANPGDADALHQLGALLVELSTCPGRGSPGATCLTCPICQRTPQGPGSGHSAQLSSFHKDPLVVDAAQVAEGMRLLQAAINHCPGNARYRRSLGVAWQRQGRADEALEAFERAFEKDATDIVSLQHQAQLLSKLQRPARAVEVYRAITHLQPEHKRAHYSLGCLLRQLGRHQQAADAFRRHLALVPDHQEAKFWTAALTGDAASAPVAPPELVAGLFDSYADNFDSHLVDKLQYRTPWLLMEVLLSASQSEAQGSCSPPWSRGVDLGCGTGLMGPLLAPHMEPRTGMLEGVDLSPGMVNKARARGCYQRLDTADLVHYLTQAAQDLDPTSLAQVPYSVLVAADVFVYVGDLQPVLLAAAQCAQPGAVLGFSTESLTEDTTTAGPEPATATQQEQSEKASCVSNGHHSTQQPAAHRAGYRLTTTGRYQHSAGYIRTVLPATGWRLQTLQDSIIRCNAGKPVHGFLCVAVRT